MLSDEHIAEIDLLIVIDINRRDYHIVSGSDIQIHMPIGIGGARVILDTA